MALFINRIQGGSFLGCLRKENKKTSPAKKILDIFYNDETWQSYTLSKDN